MCDKREENSEVENSVIRRCAAALMGNGIPKFLGNADNYVSPELIVTESVNVCNMDA
jgi:hypothetical protein